jgi:hypothetical protein
MPVDRRTVALLGALALDLKRSRTPAEMDGPPDSNRETWCWLRCRTST